MKFKNYIETESGIKDTSTSPGTAGQVLSSTVTGTSWIDPDTLEAAASKLVVISCKNVSGAQILKGTPVYQSGTVGATDVIEVEPADATISTGYLPAIGILQTTLNNNGFGNVVITGEFLNYSTSGIPSNNPGGVPITGDTVYLAVGGGLTCIKPTGAGNAIQNLGLIGKVSGGNAGSITVSSIMRANDVPNLPEGRIWIGDGNTIVSDTVYVDEPNNRVGIGTTSPSTVLEVSSSGVNGVDISQSASNTSQSGRLFFTTNTASEGFALFNSNGTFQVNSGGIPNNTSGTNRISIIGSSGNVGIGTTVPTRKLHVLGPGNSTPNIAGGIFLQTSSGGGLDIYATSTAANPVFDFRTFGGEEISFSPNSTELMRLKGSNVGIGTINPGSKLQVDGEIDANGGDGYRINGKPWAAESASVLRLGDWDGENFSTSIYDENSIETFEVKDQGVIINCDRTKATSYGADASLVVGGIKSSPWGAGVVTLLNNDPTSQAGDSTGLIQFAIKDDQNTSAGYTSASIKGSIDFAAGTGSSGGGILDFLTSAGGLGSSPSPRMRINRLGNVGIGTTSPQSKLQVNGGVQLANDTAAASASKVGTFRYRTSGNNSYVDMCMQTGASTYAWVNIVTNSW